MWEGGGDALKGDEEALNDDVKACKGDKEALKGSGEALKGDGKASICNEEAYSDAQCKSWCKSLMGFLKRW